MSLQGKNKIAHTKLGACLRASGLCVVCFVLCAALLSASAFSPAVLRKPPASAVEAPLAASFSQLGVGGRQAAELPESVELPVHRILQTPQLPNGCEATSLAMVLQYYGFAADKAEIAYSYIPREDFVWTDNNLWGPHPEDAFAGDPAGLGFYCFAPPVVAGANLYLSAQDSALVAMDISGAGRELLQTCLAEGGPVLLWTTLDYSEPEYSSFAWTLPGGEVYTPYVNLHCEVLYGYDTENFYLCDPLQGREAIPIDTVLHSYEALGGYAVVIL